MKGPFSRAISRRVVLGAALYGLASRGGVAGQAPGGAESRAFQDPVEVNGRVYDAYIPAATKPGQFFHYTCEFDASWVIFETFGLDVGFEEQLAIAGHDQSIEPYYVETPDGVEIYGGDVASAFCGDFKTNYLARMRAPAMREVFEAYGLPASPVRKRAHIEDALRRGELVWLKVTVDFKPWTPARWVTPDGRRYRTVLGNDHAVVAIGFNSDVVVIRDVLGPTSSNWERPYEYEVDWPTFLASVDAHAFDGLAVARPAP